MRIPRHIGVIPDGNRRWALSQQMEKKDGYQYGLEPGMKLLKKAKEYGVEESRKSPTMGLQRITVKDPRSSLRLSKVPV